MTNISYFLSSFFQTSPINKQSNEYLNKRGDNPGFGNASSQKTPFPASSDTKSDQPTSNASQPASNTSKPPVASSSSKQPSSSLTPTPTPTSTNSILSSSITTDSLLSSSSSSITTSPSSSTAADQQNGSSGGLSGGAIGAIVAVIIIVIGGVAAFFIMRRQRRKRIEMKASAGAMRDPYNEGFTSFPPPPPPMSSINNNHNHNNNNNNNNNINNNNNQYSNQNAFNNINTNVVAAGSAQPLSPPPNVYQYNNPTSPSAAYPMTSPIINSPVLPSPTTNNNLGMAYTTPAVAAAATVAAPIAMNNLSQPQQPQQPGDIWQQPPLGTYTVVTTYSPTLSDEIDVQPGDQVQIFEEYDDGWCLGINLTRGQTRGVFPKHCVTPDQQQQQQQVQLSNNNPSSHSLAISDQNTSSVGKRVSSLIMDSSPVANN